MSLAVVGDEAVDFGFDVGGLGIDAACDAFFAEFGEHPEGGLVALDPVGLVLGQATIAPVFRLWVPEVSLDGESVTKEMCGGATDGHEIEIRDAQ